MRCVRDETREPFETRLDPPPDRLHAAAQEECVHRVRRCGIGAAHPVAAPARAESRRRRRDHHARKAARTVAGAHDRRWASSPSCSRTSAGSAAAASRSTCSTTCAPRLPAAAASRLRPPRRAPDRPAREPGFFRRRVDPGISAVHAHRRREHPAVRRFARRMFWLSPLLSLVMLAVGPALLFTALRAAHVGVSRELGRAAESGRRRQRRRGGRDRRSRREGVRPGVARARAADRTLAAHVRRRVFGS